MRALYPEVEDALELTVVSSVSTLVATLDIVSPEVIFLDLALTHPAPMDAVRRVRRLAPDVPLIVFAGANDKDCAVSSLSQGAQDYLLKEFINFRTLERVLRATLERNTLEGLADLLRDSFTGLYTRDGFLTLGARAMEMAKGRESTLVLLCLRIENLLTVRTEYGPRAAEKCGARGPS
ncbi:MAG TPA: response regulator [Candidatus Acidoferrum sp.]|nr:response regulator [Candidatus Acidoferrum sp.]